MTQATRVLLLIVILVAGAVSILALLFLLTRLDDVYLPTALRPYVSIIFWVACAAAAASAVLHAVLKWRYRAEDH